LPVWQPSASSCEVPPFAEVEGSGPCQLFAQTQLLPDVVTLESKHPERLLKVPALHPCPNSSHATQFPDVEEFVSMSPVLHTQKRTQDLRIATETPARHHEVVRQLRSRLRRA